MSTKAAQFETAVKFLGLPTPRDAISNKSPRYDASIPRLQVQVARELNRVTQISQLSLEDMPDLGWRIFYDERALNAPSLERIWANNSGWARKDIAKNSISDCTPIINHICGARDKYMTGGPVSKVVRIAAHYKLVSFSLRSINSMIYGAYTYVL
jgi:hypothetical protein